MPEWMQYLGNALPSTQGIQMFIQLNQMGIPTNLVIPKMIYLATVGAILLVWGYFRLTQNNKKSCFDETHHNINK